MSMTDALTSVLSLGWVALTERNEFGHFDRLQTAPTKTQPHRLMVVCPFCAATAIPPFSTAAKRARLAMSEYMRAVAESLESLESIDFPVFRDS